VNAFTRESALRPLGLGEVLDRAVNLCVKYFVPLTAIFLVYAVPLAVVQYFASQNSARVMQALVDFFMHAGKNPDLLSKEINSASGIDVWTPVVLLLTFFVGPLPMAALIVAAAGFYLGKPVSFGSAYHAALSRWPHLIGLNVMYLLTGGFLYLAVIIVGAVLGLGIGLLYALQATVGIAVGIAVGVVLLVLLVGFAIVAVLAVQMAYFGCVLEGQNLAVAFASGIRRVFVGIGLRRSLLVGTAFFAILIGIEFVSGAGEALLIGLVRSTIAGTIYGTVVRVATAAFTTAFITIFYYDLRVREEALDLQMAAQAAQTRAQLSTT
jgi:hypothetical protein